MKILAVGDLIGSAGIGKLKSVLPELRKKEGIDFVIVNVYPLPTTPLV